MKHIITILPYTVDKNDVLEELLVIPTKEESLSPFVGVAKKKTFIASAKDILSSCLKEVPDTSKWTYLGEIHIGDVMLEELGIKEECEIHCYVVEIEEKLVKESDDHELMKVRNILHVGDPFLSTLFLKMYVAMFNRKDGDDSLGQKDSKEQDFDSYKIV